MPGERGLILVFSSDWVSHCQQAANFGEDGTAGAPVRGRGPDPTRVEWRRGDYPTRTYARRPPWLIVSPMEKVRRNQRAAEMPDRRDLSHRALAETRVASQAGLGALWGAQRGWNRELGSLERQNMSIGKSAWRPMPGLRPGAKQRSPAQSRRGFSRGRRDPSSRRPGGTSRTGWRVARP